MTTKIKQQVMTTKIKQESTTDQTRTGPPTQKTLRYIHGLPLVGNLPEILKDHLGFFRLIAQTNDICVMRFGPFPIFLLNKSEHFYSILVEHAYDFDRGTGFHHILRSMLGENLLSSDGNAHRCQRKLLAPPFQPRHIVGYAEIMGYYSEHIQKTWTDGGVIDLHQQMNSLAMSIIGKVLFDADVFTATDELGAATLTIEKHVSHAISMPFLPPFSWPLPGNRRSQKALQVLRNHFKRFINERRHSPVEHNDLLSILLQTRDENGLPMSDEQLMAECMVLFGAGYETTAAALSWTWYLLCQHPQSYQKVQREVDSVLQGRTPVYADLAQLPYCLQVFKEAIRLYPSVPVIIRRALRDVEIDGHHIPKGRTVFLAPYTLHRREEYFPDPEQFDPERFASEQEKQLPRYAYLPFGAGPRVCIGNYLTLMEGHLLLATLVQRVAFELLPGQNITSAPNSITLQPNTAILVTVKKR